MVQVNKDYVIVIDEDADKKKFWAAE